MTKKKTTSAIFLDLAKAYDSTWITGLLYKITKLKIYGPVLRWIKNFITKETSPYEWTTIYHQIENSREEYHKDVY